MSGAGGASVLIVAGETSGEEHAAGLVKALRRSPAPELDFFGSGGGKMRAAGVELLADVSQLGAIGPGQALAHLRAYRRLFRRLISESRRRRPELAILVDFPEFNLRLASRLKAEGIPVCYFIGPQVWAWRRGRVKQIRRCIDLMLVILPFEEEFYGRHGIEAHYVGHPTAGHLAVRADRATESDAGAKRIALLPGSRRGEVSLNLPVQLDAAARIAGRLEARFEIARAPAVSIKQLESICRSWSEGQEQELDVSIAVDSSVEVLSRADAAVVKSGTSTLEAMILGVPFAMTYRVSWTSWLLLRPFVRVRNFCLANLVAGNAVVPEFVQQRAIGDNIGDAIVRVLENPEERRRMVEGLAEGRRRLGTRDAFKEAADRIRERFFRGTVGSLESA